MQRLLTRRPRILAAKLTGGHGRWVIPQTRLGSEYVPDFVIGDDSSLGYRWIAVELESTGAKIFNRNGDFSAALTHAVRQITDWRTWLRRNHDYAVRPLAEQGLGLLDIDVNVRGLILIGREAVLDPDTTERRRIYGEQQDIDIHTFDWLGRGPKHRLAAPDEEGRPEPPRSRRRPRR